jgi:hypothetical protein
VKWGVSLRFVPSWLAGSGRRLPPDPRTQFLLHIPKTAGSTIAGTIADAIGPDSVRVLDSDVTATEFFEREYTQGSHVRFVTAHCRLARLPDGRRFTTIRQPIDRLISLFLHFRREPSIYPIDPSSDLPAFFDRMMQLGPTEVSNTHCWYLGGETAESARRALEQEIQAWSVMDKVERLLAEIFRSLGTRGATIEVRNASPPGRDQAAWRDGARPGNYGKFFAGLPAAARDRILEANREDLKLWDWAKKEGGFGRRR